MLVEAPKLKRLDNELKKLNRVHDELDWAIPISKTLVGKTRLHFSENQLWLVENFKWLPPLDFPAPHLIMLRKEIKPPCSTYKIEIVNMQITRFYREHYRAYRIIAHWMGKNPRKRLDVLKETVTAHYLGKYALSVLVFLANAEGVIVDSMLRYKESTKKKDFIRFNDLKKHLGKIAEGEDANAKFVGILLQAMWHLVTDPFSQEDARKYPIDVFELNRNAIMHGANASYGTEVTSLKLMVLLDLLIKVLLEPANWG